MSNASEKDLRFLYREFMKKRSSAVRFLAGGEVKLPLTVIDCGTYQWEDIRKLIFALPGWKEIAGKFSLDTQTPQPFYDFINLFFKRAKTFGDYKLINKIHLEHFALKLQDPYYTNLSNAFINTFFYLKEHYPYYFTKRFAFAFIPNFHFKQLSFYDVFGKPSDRTQIDQIFQRLIARGFSILQSNLVAKSREEFLSLKLAESCAFAVQMLKSETWNYDYINTHSWFIINEKSDIEFLIVSM